MKKLILILMILGSQKLWALPTKSISFAWDASPDATVTGYKFYFATTSEGYTATNSIDVGNVLTFTWQQSTPGTYFESVTAYNAQGLESPFSNEVSFNIPRPPIMLAITGHSLTINSYQGANLVLASSPDLINWSNQNLLASADTMTIPISETLPVQFYRASYISTPVAQLAKALVQKPLTIPSVGTPPLPPMPVAPKLTVWKKLALLFRYKPRMHPDFRKGAQRLMSPPWNEEPKKSTQMPPLPPMPPMSQEKK